MNDLKSLKHHKQVVDLINNQKIAEPSYDLRAHLCSNEACLCPCDPNRPISALQVLLAHLQISDQEQLKKIIRKMFNKTETWTRFCIVRTSDNSIENGLNLSAG